MNDHPDVLAKLFSKMPAEMARSAVPYMVSRWTEDDPAAADLWVADLPGGLRQHVEQDRSYRLAVLGSEAEVTARVAALAQIDDSRKRNRALRKLGSHLHGLDEADQVLANILDASLQAELRLAMEVEDRSQGRGADEKMKTYLTELQDPALRSQWTAWTAERMERDPEEAARWLGEQPQDFYDQQSWLLQSLGRAWSRKDPEAASAWIASLPASAGKDQAIQQLVYGTTAWEPEAALAWTAVISQPGMRELEASRVLRQWSRFDVAAAQEALTAVAGFSDEERRRIGAAANFGRGAAP